MVWGGAAHQAPSHLTPPLVYVFQSFEFFSSRFVLFELLSFTPFFNSLFLVLFFDFFLSLSAAIVQIMGPHVDMRLRQVQYSFAGL